jgi:hypothetical protein
MRMSNGFYRRLMACWIILTAGAWTFAKDLYVAQTASGNGDGTKVANAQSAAWFNSAQNWGSGAGQISPGDVVHLCGVIGTTLTVQGSGTSGHAISIVFEPNARLSQAAGTLMYCQSKKYVVIDGGSNGIIENTNNGTTLGNQAATTGIYAPGCSEFEVKNLTVQNLYVHASAADSALDFGASGGIYMNGFGNHVSIHDCIFHDICWVLNMGSGIAGASGLSLYNNSFSNYDHAVAGIGGAMSAPANVNIHDNHFGATANWDTTANTYHHDGIHIYFAPGGSLSGVNIYNNLFDGNWGANNTAHIFVEGDWSRANPNAVSNVKLWNNVFQQYAGNTLNDGFLWGGGPGWAIYNNTFCGARVTNSTAIFLGGTGLAFKNNLFTNVTTFISLWTGASFAAGGLNQNLYAEPWAGGNPPWSAGGSGCATLAQWQSVTAQDSQSTMAAQANLNTDGTLKASSPAVGTGADLSAFFLTDKTGATRTAPWDIGAYKYVPTAPAAPKNLRVLSQ